MKKIFKFITLSLALLCIFSLVSCSSPDFNSSISELRQDIFFGESENYKVVVYAGTKENPSSFDGVVTATNLTLTFKITKSQKPQSQLKVKFKIDDKEYFKDLLYTQVQSSVYGEIIVDNLPQKTFDIEIFEGENSEVILTKSLIKEDTISYNEALEKAVDKAKNFIKSHTKNREFKGEIVIRLLSENSKNYYYVGFIDESGLREAYLIDGKSGNILAEKIL